MSERVAVRDRISDWINDARRGCLRLAGLAVVTERYRCEEQQMVVEAFRAGRDSGIRAAGELPPLALPRRGLHSV